MEGRFMTNTDRKHKVILEAMQIYYPGAVEVFDEAYDSDGRLLEGFISVHVGSKPLVDYSEFWDDFSRLLKLHGLRD